MLAVVRQRCIREQLVGPLVVEARELGQHLPRRVGVGVGFQIADDRLGDPGLPGDVLLRQAQRFARGLELIGVLRHTDSYNGVPITCQAYFYGDGDFFSDTP